MFDKLDFIVEKYEEMSIKRAAIYFIIAVLSFILYLPAKAIYWYESIQSSSKTVSGEFVFRLNWNFITDMMR